MNTPVIVGRFGRVFGVKGWIHVISFTDPKTNILSYSPWWVMTNQRGASAWQALVVAHHHKDEKKIRVKIEGCESPEAAQSFVNQEIAVSRDQLPSLVAGQYYWSDLEGLLVKNIQGQLLGHVDYLFETGANDVMVVKGNKTHWIPFSPSVLLEVNLKEKWMLVDWEADF